MKTKLTFTAFAVVLVLAVLVNGLKGPVGTAGVPILVPPEGAISIVGEMVCLPHKNTSGPQTTECAFGLQDDTGRYFALADTDPNYGNIMGVGGGERIRAEGTFEPKSSSNYQDIGIIHVTKITKLASAQ